jgi:hypothetical protein
VAGLTPSEAAASVAASLRKFIRDPEVTVAVNQQGQMTVLVLGNLTDVVAVRAAIQKLHGLGANNLLGTVANLTRPTRRGGYDDYFFADPAKGPPILT